MIDLPEEVYRVFNEDMGFHKLIRVYKTPRTTLKDAFYKALDRVQEFYPDYDKYTSYESYKSAYFNKMYRRLEVTGITKKVPENIFNAVSSRQGFDTEYDLLYKELQHKDNTFIHLMREIKEYFPRYYKYKNAYSYLMARDTRIRNKK